MYTNQFSEDNELNQDKNTTKTTDDDPIILNTQNSKSSTERKRSLTTKMHMTSMFVIAVLICLVSTIYYNTRNNEGENTKSSQQVQQAPQGIQENTVSKTENTKSQLLICSGASKSTYNPYSDTKSPTELCLSDNNTLNITYSNSRGMALIESYGSGSQRNLYLVNTSNPYNKQLVYSVDSSKFIILEKIWLDNDSGFFFAVRDDTIAKELGDPHPMSYYKSIISNDKASEPVKIYSSTGSHASSEHILGYDKERDLLITLSSGPGGCFEIYTIKLGSSEKEQFENNSCDLSIDYSQAFLYKVEVGSEGALLAQSYLEGDTITLAKSEKGYFSGLVATNDFKYIYMTQNISGKKSGDYIDTADEKNEIVRYKIDDRSLETIRSFSKNESVRLDSLDTTGNYLVYSGQDFSGSDESWPNYTTLLNVISKEEKNLSLGEYSSGQYLVWIPLDN